MRFHFRPWVTLAALPVLLVLLSLGNWQVDRLAWKKDLIAKVESRANADTGPLPRAESLPSNLDELHDGYDFTPVIVEGRFDHDAELLIAGISAEGQGGYKVLTPLRLPDGAWLMVERGFVPPQFKDQLTRLNGLPNGEVTVSGLLQAPARSGYFTPANSPEKGQWYHVDLALMGQTLERSFYPLVLSADHPPQGDFMWPQGGQARVSFPNNHLGYAITWFGLACSLVAVWLAMSIKRR